MLDRIRWKKPDPGRYRELKHPWEWIPRVLPKSSARSRRERALETIDSLSQDLE